MLELLLPRVCAECRTPLLDVGAAPLCAEKALCGVCLATLSLLDPIGCTHCQRELTPSGERRKCRRCSSERSALDSCTARVEFAGNAEKWIRAYKYPDSGIVGLAPGPQSIATALARDAAANCKRSLPDAIVPIPLHPNRLKARGFNPAAALARAIAKQADRPLETELLVRERDTPTQTHLGRKARRKNVRGAFACTKAANATIWLIDDVVTTGSTLEEAARCLRRAGAVRVHAICVARTSA